MYQGYSPSPSPMVPEQIKGITDKLYGRDVTDKLYQRIDGSNQPLDIFKNGFINGAFDWNQRGQASYVAGPSQALYTFDRWGVFNMGPNGATSVTSQTFGLGETAANSDYFIRVGTANHTGVSDGGYLYQAMEGIRKFAGKRCVLRGMARRYSGAGNVSASLMQAFGTGGSASVTKSIGSFTPTAVWAPFAMIVDVPPISAAQTAGAGSYVVIRLFLSAGSNFNAETGNLGLQTLAVDFSDLEFKEIAPGYGDQFPGYERIPREVELMRSMRFYQVGRLGGGIGGNSGNGGYNGGYIGGNAMLPVVMRVTPSVTFTDFNGNSGYVQTGNGAGQGLSGGGLAATDKWAFMDATLGSGAQTYWWACYYKLAAEI